MFVIFLQCISWNKIHYNKVETYIKQKEWKLTLLEWHAYRSSLYQWKYHAGWKFIQIFSDPFNPIKTLLIATHYSIHAVIATKRNDIQCWKFIRITNFNSKPFRCANILYTIQIQHCTYVFPATQKNQLQCRCRIPTKSHFWKRSQQKTRSTIPLCLVLSAFCKYIDSKQSSECV